MRAPVSWLREYVDLPEGLSPRELAAALVRVGLEVETVEVVGEGLSGPLVVGRVEQIEELTEFRKPIRFCQVDVGAAHGGVRGIVCGARNFAVGDLVPVVLPGAVLPGDFRIAARKTYGHTSDGMICSANELGIGDSGDGIIVLDPAAGEPGDDAAAVLGIGEAVLDIAVTPDRGYCLSIRGLAREAGIALAVPFHDPAQAGSAKYPDPDAPAPRIEVDDPGACPLFTAVLVEGVDRRAPTPEWLKARLVAAGMRSVSLAVDVTNYVMLELGQPLHAFDADTVAGGIVVRRARPGESLLTLDHVERALDPDDLLIADDDGPIGLAGVMGGESTEISEATTTIILEAAHFGAEVIARAARRHKLPSEASKRFERGVDPALPWIASQRAAELLVGIGGGRIGGGTGVGELPPAAAIELPADLAARVSGADIPPSFAAQALAAVGCSVDAPDSPTWSVLPPTWRPDLRDPADLVEEVVRLYGYENLPATLPAPPAGRGLTTNQIRRRAVSRALAGAGLTEVLAYPFVGAEELAALGIADGDPRASCVRLANPLSEEQALMRTTLLPGLLAIARRNVGRGTEGLALYETGLVFLPGSPGSAGTAGGARPVRPGVTDRPSVAELAAVEALLPEQPLHVAAVLAGALEPAGTWGRGRSAGWQDAVAAARTAAGALGVALRAEPDSDRAPWHPGRCARLSVGDRVVGYAGELHPRVVESLGLPKRSAAMECDLDALFAVAPAVVSAPVFSTFPVAKEDVAVIVAEEVSAAEVAGALAGGAGELLESVRLFDEYRGEQVGQGRKSLAFALRFRAPDRTLSDAEVASARDAAVASAVARFSAELRSG